MILTAQDIIKEKGSMETCILAESVFSVLYSGNEDISEAEFAISLPETMQLFYFLKDAANHDFVEEYLVKILEEIKDEKERRIYQEKIVWALNKIGRQDIALVFKKVIDIFNSNGILDKNLTRKAHDKFIGYKEGLYDDLAKIIKNDTDNIITQEYKKKAAEMLKKEPAHKFKSEDDYKKEISEKYPWFKK